MFVTGSCWEINSFQIPFSMGCQKDIYPVFTDIGNYLPISENELPISVNKFPISVNKFPISVNHLPISVNHLPISVNGLDIYGYR